MRIDSRFSQPEKSIPERNFTESGIYTVFNSRQLANVLFGISIIELPELMY